VRAAMKIEKVRGTLGVGLGRIDQGHVIDCPGRVELEPRGLAKWKAIVPSATVSLARVR